jgi:hypothetical protein
MDEKNSLRPAFRDFIEIDYTQYLIGTGLMLILDEEAFGPFKMVNDVDTDETFVMAISGPTAS